MRKGKQTYVDAAPSPPAPFHPIRSQPSVETLIARPNTALVYTLVRLDELLYQVREQTHIGVGFAKDLLRPNLISRFCTGSSEDLDSHMSVECIIALGCLQLYNFVGLF